jgi:galactose mutarotase-like enzyme
MGIFTIENDELKVSVSSAGAELQSIFGKFNQLEYLWDGNPAFWAKRSPVLFPIIGTLRANRYIYKDRTYTMGRHGFAREKEFELINQNQDKIQFSMRDDESTRAIYPFSFEFLINYKLDKRQLAVEYIVKNLGRQAMFFSVGGHPAFKLPLVNGTAYEDYFLEFNEEETKPRWPISREGLIEKQPIPLLVSTDILPLSKELFAKDALVLKFPTSSVVSLKSEKTQHGLDFNFEGFPYLGLWAAPQADFICIEPWCGIADPVDSDQQLIHKEGIVELDAGKEFERKWVVELF